MKRLGIALSCALVLCLGCDSKKAPEGPDQPSTSRGGCPSWTGTLGGSKISGNDVHVTPAPMSGIALRAYKSGDILDSPLLMGSKQSMEGDKVILMANGALAGHLVTSISGTKVVWDRKARTITGTLKDSKTQKEMPLSITYKNETSDAAPEHCHK